MPCQTTHHGSHLGQSPSNASTLMETDVTTMRSDCVPLIPVVMTPIIARRTKNLANPARKASTASYLPWCRTIPFRDTIAIAIDFPFPKALHQLMYAPMQRNP